MAERERRHRDPVSLSFYGFLFAAALWAVAQPLWEFRRPRRSVSLQGNLFQYTAPVWALVGFIRRRDDDHVSLLTGALRHIPATRASIVATLEPVVATVVAWVWFPRAFAAQLVGGAVVLAGIFLAHQPGSLLGGETGPSASPAATALGSSAPSRRSSARSSTTSPRSTCGSRSVTTSTLVCDLEARGAIFVEEETEEP